MGDFSLRWFSWRITLMIEVALIKFGCSGTRNSPLQFLLFGSSSPSQRRSRWRELGNPRGWELPPPSQPHPAAGSREFQTRPNSRLEFGL